MGWKKGLLAVVVAIAVGAWVCLGLSFWLGLDQEVGIFFVMAAAFTTEAAFWVLALVLGVSVYESRRRIWCALVRSSRMEIE